MAQIAGAEQRTCEMATIYRTAFWWRAEAAVSVRLSGEAAPMAAAAAARKAAMGTAAPSLVVLAAPVREERKTKAEPVALVVLKKPAQAAREHWEWAVTAGKVTQLATCLKAAAGYYGGGGGGGSGPLGNGGAGGGGSGYVEPTATDVHMWRNWARANGDGLVVLRW